MTIAISEYTGKIAVEVRPVISRTKLPRKDTLLTWPGASLTGHCGNISGTFSRTCPILGRAKATDRAGCRQNYMNFWQDNAKNSCTVPQAEETSRKRDVHAKTKINLKI